MAEEIKETEEVEDVRDGKGEVDIPYITGPVAEWLNEALAFLPNSLVVDAFLTKFPEYLNPIYGTEAYIRYRLSERFRIRKYDPNMESSRKIKVLQGKTEETEEGSEAEPTEAETKMYLLKMIPFSNPFNIIFELWEMYLDPELSISVKRQLLLDIQKQIDRIMGRDAASASTGKPSIWDKIGIPDAPAPFMLGGHGGRPLEDESTEESEEVDIKKVLEQQDD